MTVHEPTDTSEKVDRESVECILCRAQPGQACEFADGPAPIVDDNGTKRRAVHAARYAETLPPQQRGRFWEDAVERYLSAELERMNATTDTSTTKGPALKIYIAVIADRHAEPEPHPFSTAEKAIAYAKQGAIDSARRPGDVEEEQIDGWLYYARYSSEGDSVWVVETELDADPAADATHTEGAPQ